MCSSDHSPGFQSAITVLTAQYLPLEEEAQLRRGFSIEGHLLAISKVQQTTTTYMPPVHADYIQLTGAKLNIENARSQQS